MAPSRGIVVQKYGGSSVADVRAIHGVADRVVATVQKGHAVVVVVSAMGNTTNELLALARRVCPQPGRRELDMLISVGERITMALLAMAIEERGVPALSLTGSQSGIITDERHASARVVEVRPHRVQGALEAGRVAIVAGFQGVSRTREVTTLGRGGSDTTAVALAAALQAEVCEICSDVDGIYSADPRQVPEAQRLDLLSHDEALILFRGGARVLHPEAMAFARHHGIVIHAVSTHGSQGGTILRPDPVEAGAGAVRALALDPDLTVFCAPSGGEHRLWDCLRRAEAPVRAVRGGRVWVDDRDFHQRGTVRLPEGVEQRRCARLTGTGRHLDPQRLLLKAGEALHAAGIPVLYQEAEPERAVWLVDGAAGAEALRVLHGELVAPALHEE